MALAREARAGEIARANVLLQPGSLLLIYGPWPQDASSVAAAVLRSNPDRRIARIDLDACSNDADLKSALIRASGAVLSDEPLPRSTVDSASSPSQSRTLIQLRRAFGRELDDIEHGGDATGGARPSEIVGAAVQLIDSVGATLAIDSADELVSNRRGRFTEVRAFLWALRAAAQRAFQTPIVLSGGPRAGALVEKEDEAFLGWGASLQLGRIPRETLAAAVSEHLKAPTPVEVADEIARLSGGAPWVAELIIDRLSGARYDHAAVRRAWDGVIRDAAPSIRVTLRLVSDLHRSAHAVCKALAQDQAPYAAGTPSDVNRALTALHHSAVAYQPSSRAWELCDPILAAWLRGDIAEL
jgi:hypothetical protein